MGNCHRLTGRGAGEVGVSRNASFVPFESRSHDFNSLAVAYQTEPLAQFFRAAQ
jgi:hypothetical protein